MSYYTLPKKPEIDIELQPVFYKTDDNKPEPFISQTLVTYINNSKKTIEDVITRQKSDVEELEKKITDDIIDELISIVNQYNYIYKIVPGTVLSVSKLKPDSIDFYNMMEIIINLNVFEYFPKQDMKTFIIGKNASSIKDYMDICREDYNDKNNIFNNLEDYGKNAHENTDTAGLLFYDISEENSKNNLTTLLQILTHILECQQNNGVTILKISDIVYKHTVEFIYFLTTIFNKTIIYKPNTVCSTSNVRYLVCKGYIVHSKYNKYIQTYKDIFKTILRIKEKKIKSFISVVPYYFINKIEESNIILGHQALESYDLIVSLITSKNRKEKMESLSKVSINKCIQWCEKYKIPYNKFTDKVNIFLSPSLHGMQIKENHISENNDSDLYEDNIIDNDANDDIDNEDEDGIEMNIENTSIDHVYDEEMTNTFKIINDIIMDNLDETIYENQKITITLEDDERFKLIKNDVSNLIDNIVNKVVDRVKNTEETIISQDNVDENTIINKTSHIRTSLTSKNNLYIHAVLKNMPTTNNDTNQDTKKSFSIKINT